MSPLSSSKRPLKPTSSLPPSKKLHTSPDSPRNHPALNATYTKSPNQPPKLPAAKHSSTTQSQQHPKHPDTLPPLPHGSLPSPSATSSPQKKQPQPQNTNIAAQSLMFKWCQSHRREEMSSKKTVVTVEDYNFSNGTSKPGPQPWVNMACLHWTQTTKPSYPRSWRVMSGWQMTSWITNNACWAIQQDCRVSKHKCWIVHDVCGWAWRVHSNSAWQEWSLGYDLHDWL